MIKELWKRTGAFLEQATPDTTFCSAHGNDASHRLLQLVLHTLDSPPLVSLSTPGLYSFLSTTLFIFTKDPYSCIPLFSDSESRCLFALGRLLGTDWSVFPPLYFPVICHRDGTDWFLCPAVDTCSPPPPGCRRRR